MKKRKNSNPRLTADKRPTPIPAPKIFKASKGKGSYKRNNKVKEW